MPGVFRQVYAGFAGGLGMLITGCWLGWTSPFLRKLKRGMIPFNLTLSETSWVVALMDFGNVVSPIPSGYMMDFVGRKPTFLMTAVVFLLSWVFAIIAQGAELLYIARLLAGFGKGMAFVVLPLYLAEIAEVRIRGALSTLITILLFSGTVIYYAIGPLLTYSRLNAISIVVPVVFLLCVLIIPESPYYCLMKKNKPRAFKSFCWLRAYKDKPDESTPERAAVESEVNKLDEQVQKEMAARGRWIDLVLDKGNRRATTIVMTLSAFQRFGGISCMLAYTSITLPPTGGGLDPEAYMLFFGIVLTLGNFVCLPLIDRLGRKPLLLISTLLLCFLQTTSAFFYFFYRNPNYDVTEFNWIPYCNTLFFALGYSAGIGIIPSTYLGEMYPANVKGKAAAISAMFFAFSSFLVNKIYLIVSENYGFHYMFTLFAIVNFLGALFTIFFCIETKGKTLAEIQDILKS